jgi:hypothetical protein
VLGSAAGKLFRGQKGNPVLYSMREGKSFVMLADFFSTESRKGNGEAFPLRTPFDFAHGTLRYAKEIRPPRRLLRRTALSWYFQVPPET